MCFLCYHLPCGFKIFINVFAFLYVKANSKGICEEISFTLYFLSRFKANYLELLRLINHVHKATFGCTPPSTPRMIPP